MSYPEMSLEIGVLIDTILMLRYFRMDQILQGYITKVVKNTIDLYMFTMFTKDMDI